MNIKIPYATMQSEFNEILTKVGFSTAKAEQCATIFATNSLEGIYSHGIYRFPTFVDSVKQGYVKVDAEPSMVHSAGAIEQWNGNLGPGPLNATASTDRALEIATKYGIGCVALRNTNHWMRGGAYGWRAAKQGFVFIGWTNTEKNMPAWGAKNPGLGNNPLVFAIPFGGEAIVLDFAMTQYAYGKIGTYKLEGKQLPYAGGFNDNDELTTNPDDILNNGRGLPIGLWKGAGLSLMLDILTSILSAGTSTYQLSEQETEYGVSQTFIAIDIKKLSNFPAIENSVVAIIDDLKKSIPMTPGTEIRYPGEGVVKTRNENLKNGIPVNQQFWNDLKANL